MYADAIPIVWFVAYELSLHVISNSLYYLEIPRPTPQALGHPSELGRTYTQNTMKFPDL